MMNRLLIKRLFFAFTPVYAPYCPSFAKRKTPLRVSFFLEQHFCSAKVVACGRAI